MNVGEWKLETTNKAYLAKKPSNNFNNVIQDTFIEKPSVIDFKKESEDDVRRIINQHVEEKTHGKIKNFISKGVIKPKTAFIIVNALYFKGNFSLTKHSSCLGYITTWALPLVGIDRYICFADIFSQFV